MPIVNQRTKHSRQEDPQLDKNYPENFWPILITLLSTDAFIYWVMTASDSEATMHKYLFDPILNQFK